MTNRGAAGDMEKTDEREAEHDRHRGPSSDSTKSTAHPAFRKDGADVNLHLFHAYLGDKSDSSQLNCRF